ncbi:hypothetical protein CA235_17205 [Sphingomonas sp. ABOLF]|uniref:hypothetical protein n=1 Tax=Sphingomonas sp. ABOLF TaxID=1985879 RepID=UPI000F7DE086|nr:hypothetical protein [Sphingomonas sp. ABOLF]RSV12403.1 hypothetical protein CA235_17205 [Sphingomonas sp. ABOLF]
MTTPTPDQLGETIVAKGFAPSLGVLDINGALCVPHTIELPAPWNLPSRLFRFPIEVCRPEGDEPRKVGLRHPLLASHPWVQHVAAELGETIDPQGAPNRYGYSSSRNGQYHHAVDLISAGLWRELIDTLDFTTPGSVFQAIGYGLRYSDHREDRKRNGHITTAEARTIMDELGATLPTDRAETIRQFMQPMPCNSEGKGKPRWPINGRCGGEDAAWGFIFGIEDGWFEYDRSGHLEWSAFGRDRYAIGDSTTYTETSGQAAFAF